MRRPAFVLVALGSALIAAIAGFNVARGLTTGEAAPDVSVLELPSTPTPTPQSEETPSTTAGTRIRVRSDGSNVRVNGGSECPAGCTCERRPPGGIVISCTGN